MNLAFALVSREAGGAEFQTLLLADQLRKRGHRVRLYCTDPASTPAMLEQFPPFPVRITRRPPARIFRGPLVYLALAAQFRAWLHRDRIDVAVGALPMPHALLTLACLGTRIRLIGRRGAVWPECKGYGNYDAQVPRLAAWRKRWGWRTQAILANSPAAAQSAIEVEGWPWVRVRVVPNGWPEYEPVDWSCDVPWYVARPREEKAVDVATQEFAREGVPLALSFDPPDWRQVGILVHASRADSCSNAVGMAAAHGIPVVAFDLPGNAELLHESDLVPKWDYRDLAKRVQRLRESKRLRALCGVVNHHRMRTFYPLADMVEGWERALKGENP